MSDQTIVTAEDEFSDARRAWSVMKARNAAIAPGSEKIDKEAAQAKLAAQRDSSFKPVKKSIAMPAEWLAMLAKTEAEKNQTIVGIVPTVRRADQMDGTEPERAKKPRKPRMQASPEAIAVRDAAREAKKEEDKTARAIAKGTRIPKAKSPEALDAEASKLLRRAERSEGAIQFVMIVSKEADGEETIPFSEYSKIEARLVTRLRQAQHDEKIASLFLREQAAKNTKSAVREIDELAARCIRRNGDGSMAMRIPAPRFQIVANTLAEVQAVVQKGNLHLHQTIQIAREKEDSYFLKVLVEGGKVLTVRGDSIVQLEKTAKAMLLEANPQGNCVVATIGNGEGDVLRTMTRRELIQATKERLQKGVVFKHEVVINPEGKAELCRRKDPYVPPKTRMTGAPAGADPVYSNQTRAFKAQRAW